MAELQKIIRVIRKLDPEAPHDVLLTSDATTGQNALQQVATFKDLVNVTGLVVTKLDGSARGGVLVALAEKFWSAGSRSGRWRRRGRSAPLRGGAFARSLMGLEN